jgi:cytochrome c oxidase subunit 2
MLVVIGAVVGALTTAIAVFIDWLPEQASKQREDFDFVFWVTTGICISIFSVVAAVIIYSVWKFRVQPDDESDGPPIHGHTGIEIVWTAIPAVLVTTIAIMSAIVLARAERASADDMRVKVTAQQFAWHFEYPNGVTSGTLRLPVGKTVVLDMTARDVIHSFFVPEFGQKKDAVPGIRTELVITPTKVGEYPVECTELCGLGHALMRTQAIVMEQDEFKEWLENPEGEGAQS